MSETKTSLLEKAKNLSNKPQKPQSQKPKATNDDKKPQSSKEVTILRERLREAERIMTLTEGILIQLLGENWKEYLADPQNKEFKGWQKFNPLAKNGSQGRIFVKILEEIENYRKQRQ